MKEVNPKETTRAYAFEMWMNAPMPMLTFFKTIDVTRIARISKRTGLKFNMLMCWCVGRAASRIKEFYMLPVGRKLMQYDNLAVCSHVAELHLCLARLCLYEQRNRYGGDTHDVYLPTDNYRGLSNLFVEHKQFQHVIVRLLDSRISVCDITRLAFCHLSEI